MKRVLPIFAVLVLLAAPVAGQKYSDQEAQFWLGFALYDSDQYAGALEKFRPLAEEGYALAQGMLGRMYVHGHAVPQDYVEAAKWFRKAAEQGNSEAQRELATMYARGKGVPQDYDQARNWYREAAEQGDPGSQYGLGVLYAQGKGLPQDYVQAHKWFNLAAAQGNEDAAKGREIVTKRMTPEQVAEAQTLAREWMEEHGG